MGTENSKNETGRQSQNLSKEDVQRLLEKQKREFDAKLRSLQAQNSISNYLVVNAREATSSTKAQQNSYESGTSDAFSRKSAVHTLPGNIHSKEATPAVILEPLNNLKVSSNDSSRQLLSSKLKLNNQNELQNTSQYQSVRSNSDHSGSSAQGVLTSRRHTTESSDLPQTGVLISTRGSKLYPDLEGGNAISSRPTKTFCSYPSTSRESSYAEPSRASSQKNSDYVFVDKNRLPPPHICEPSAPQEDFELEPKRFNKKRSTSRSRAHKEGDELNCRTCDNKYGLVIYNCELGHSSCAECKGKRCGVCGETITGMRNWTLEAVIAETKVPCKNKKDGCIYSLKLADMEDHLKVCLFSDLMCPLASVYGRCFWQGKISQMKSHFDDVHPSHHQAAVNMEMQLFNFVDNSRVVHLVHLGAYNFLFNLKVDKVEQKVYIAIQLMGTPSNAEKWSYEVQMFNKREPRRKYVQSDVCFSHGIPLDDIFKESKCVTIPLAYALGYVNEARLTYKFYIKKDVERFENHSRGRGRGWGRGRGRGAQAS